MRSYLAGPLTLDALKKQLVLAIYLMEAGALAEAELVVTYLSERLPEIEPAHVQMACALVEVVAVAGATLKVRRSCR